jgi:hypothetical protein
MNMNSELGKNVGEATVNSLERLRENVKYSVYHICFFSTDQAEI